MIKRTQKNFISKIEIRNAINNLLKETQPYEECELANFPVAATKCANCVLNELKKRLDM